VVLKENEELLKGQAQNKKITTVNENKVSLPVKIHRHSINTVVRNLLSNAIKFTQEGGSITLSVEEKGNHFVVAVTDTGVGMSPEAIQKLFLLGTKHSTLGTAKEKGTGLGLSATYGIMQDHGGQITCENHPEGGAIFMLRFPIAKVGMTTDAELVNTYLH